MCPSFLPPSFLSSFFLRRVHALNCLRMAFQDAYLAVDVSAYLAPAMQTAVLGMAAPQWEVRGRALPGGQAAAVAAARGGWAAGGFGALQYR